MYGPEWRLVANVQTCVKTMPMSPFMSTGIKRIRDCEWLSTRANQQKVFYDGHKAYIYCEEHGVIV